MQYPTATVQIDSPVTNTENDELNYAPLAQHIAECIRQAPAVDGLVFSINGAWGSGKTTMLEFIKKYLHEGDKDLRPAVLEFNPWWHSTPDGLIFQFLRFLEEEVPGLKLEQSTKEILISFARTTIKKFTRAVVSNIPVPDTVKDTIKQTIEEPNPQKASPSELRKSIAQSLTNRNQIVVIIDDIDRLMPSEMRQLFQLIRAVCNLPNILYILAFDRAIVAESISRDLGISGEKFLEKIVQIPFDLPASGGSRVRKMFVRRADQLAKDTPSELFDTPLWSGLYLAGIEPLLETPRSVIRLFNALSITYPPVRGEIDFADFIAVEALRIFLPQVYETIRSNKPLFVDGLNINDHEASSSFHRIWLEGIANLKIRDAAKEIILRIFPATQRAFIGPLSFSPIPRTTSLQLRASTTRGFDKCFNYSLSSDDVPRSLYNKIIRSETDIDALIASLRQLASPNGSFDQGNRALSFLQYLRDDAKHRRIPDGRSKILFVAIMNAVDELMTASVSDKNHDIGTERVLPWAIDALLWGIPQSEIVQSLKECLWTGDCAIVVAAHLAREVELARPSQGSTPFESAFLIDGEALVLVHDFLIQRLESADARKIVQLPEFLQILFAVNFFRPEAVKQFVSKIEIDPDLYVRFARQIVSRPSISTGFRYSIETKIGTDTLRHLGISVDRFTSQLSSAQHAQTTETTQRDAQFLLTLLANSGDSE